MERCRGLFAQIVDVAPESVGLLPSIVPAVAAVADSLSETAGTVVAHRDEFRSLLLPVLATLPEDRIRWVDGAYSADSFVRHIDPETSAVSISSVASHDGARPALEVIRDACRAVDAALVVDATQSLGIVPLGIPASDVDLLAGAGYKGLRGSSRCPGSSSSRSDSRRLPHLQRGSRHRGAAGCARRREPVASNG